MTRLIVATILLSGCTIPADSKFWDQVVDVEVYGIYAVHPAYGTTGIGYLHWKRNVK